MILFSTLEYDGFPGSPEVAARVRAYVSKSMDDAAPHARIAHLQPEPVAQ